MSDPVVYVEQQFNALKSFMRRQPSSWEPTGNTVVDAANHVRFQLKDTATGYAYTIRKALRNAAEIYGMNPEEPKITIHDPKKANEQIDARQQRRIVELHEEFNTYILEHGIRLKSGCDSLDDEKTLTASATPVLKWYFTDKNNVRHGPISDDQLKTFIQHGVVIPETPLETINGHKGTAGQVKGLFDVQAMQTVNPIVTHSESLPKDIPALRTNSVTSAHAKEKVQIFFGIGLLCLIPILLAWAAVGLELLFNNSMQKWGITAMSCSVIFGIPAVVCFYKAAVEKLADWSACPKCGMLKADKLMSREETNFRFVFEQKPTDSGMKSMPVTCYTNVFHYQCPFCNHEWKEKRECKRNGHDL